MLPNGTDREAMIVTGEQHVAERHKFFSSKCLILKSKNVRAMLLGHLVTGSCGEKKFFANISLLMR